MNGNDLKIYGINTIAMAANFSEIDLVLKIVLTIVVIGYTLHKWYLMNKKNKNETNK
tara:strand:- start:1863 stop:2033 length:171 start_codon:yes stop_codon:yes gene_type:complete